MHTFIGKWITDQEFFDLKPRNVFHRQLEKMDIPCEEHRNRHILFRKSFVLEKRPQKAAIYLTADDYYKLYINGRFVSQGPAPCYHFRYNYHEVDVTEFLEPGENLIAVHTLYQGLINRVWQSGDLRHGMILDLEADGQVIVSSDESFKTHPHSGFREMGMAGYKTQFLERYDSRSPEEGFAQKNFDDSAWETARMHRWDDHILAPQMSRKLVFEKIMPTEVKKSPEGIVYDFGGCFVGYLRIRATGEAGDTIILRCAQELDGEGRVRFELRANCRYEEEWILARGESRLDQFDYKAFRYAELLLPKGVKIEEIYLEARHYPFALQAELKAEYAENEKLRAIWELCVRTQQYGVQEVIQDCMEREKGFYVGDGCYTALTHFLLTGDDSIVRKLIDDGFSSSFITPGLVTCLDCSMMQEIAEYALMLLYLVMWHYRITGDKGYLRDNYLKSLPLLNEYRRAYEKDGLLSHLDKWCVVEWPSNFRDGYDVDIQEGKVCETAHIAINAYYIEAVRCANLMAAILGLPAYRDEKPLVEAFTRAFYLPDQKLFRDGEHTDHVSLIGNIFPFAFDLCPDEETRENILQMIRNRKTSALSMFCTFPMLQGLVRAGREDLIPEMLLDEGAWLRTIREDGKVTYEGWGRDSKWNTSLFHMTMSYAAAFLADVDIAGILAPFQL